MSPSSSTTRILPLFIEILRTGKPRDCWRKSSAHQPKKALCVLSPQFHARLRTAQLRPALHARWQPYLNLGPAFGPILRLDASAVLIDDALDDRKSQPSAARLGGHVRI